MMKVVIIFLSISTLIVKSQTTVYAVTPEGITDKANYCTFKNGKFSVCNDCRVSFKDSITYEEYKTVVFMEDHITIQLKKPEGPQNPHMIFGYVTDEKKVLFAKVEEKEEKIYVSFEPNADDIKNAAYVYDKKVFDSSGTIIAFIEGEEKYGAAWYLLTARKLQ
jgi:hypothetical protein